MLHYTPAFVRNFDPRKTCSNFRVEVSNTSGGCWVPAVSLWQSSGQMACRWPGGLEGVGTASSKPPGCFICFQLDLKVGFWRIRSARSCKFCLTTTGTQGLRHWCRSFAWWPWPLKMVRFIRPNESKHETKWGFSVESCESWNESKLSGRRLLGSWQRQDVFQFSTDNGQSRQVLKRHSLTGWDLQIWSHNMTRYGLRAVDSESYPACAKRASVIWWCLCYISAFGSFLRVSCLGIAQFNLTVTALRNPTFSGDMMDMDMETIGYRSNLCQTSLDDFDGSETRHLWDPMSHDSWWTSKLETFWDFHKDSGTVNCDNWHHSHRAILGRSEAWLGQRQWGWRFWCQCEFHPNELEWRNSCQGNQDEHLRTCMKEFWKSPIVTRSLRARMRSLWVIATFAPSRRCRLRWCLLLGLRRIPKTWTE